MYRFFVKHPIASQRNRNVTIQKSIGLDPKGYNEHFSYDGWASSDLQSPE
jgi:hypothetical protein